MASAIIQSVATPGDGSGVVQPCDVAICADGSYVLTDSQRIIRVHPPQRRQARKKQQKNRHSTPRKGKERRASPESTQWLVAGASGTAGYTDGIGHAARFSSPFGLAIGADGAAIVVADTQNHNVRVIRDFHHDGEGVRLLPSAYGGSSPTEMGAYWGGSRTVRPEGGVGADQHHPVPKVTTLAGASQLAIEGDDQGDAEQELSEQETGSRSEPDDGWYANISYDEDYYNKDEYFDGDSYGSDSVFNSPNTSIDAIDCDNVGTVAAAFRASLEGKVMQQAAEAIDSSDDDLPPDPIFFEAAASARYGHVALAPATAPRAGCTTPTPQALSTPVNNKQQPFFASTGSPPPPATGVADDSGDGSGSSEATEAAAVRRALDRKLGIGQITKSEYDQILQMSTAAAFLSPATRVTPASKFSRTPPPPPLLPLLPPAFACNAISPILSVEPHLILSAAEGAALALTAAATKSPSFSPSPTSFASKLAASTFKGRARLFPLDGTAAAPPPTTSGGQGGNKKTGDTIKMEEVLLLPDGPAEYAEFNGPLGVAVQPDGTVLVTESWQHAVRTVKDGVVRTLAGSHSSSGCVNSSNGASARFFGLLGIAVLPNGDCVVADRDNCRVRTISAAGKVSTLAGSGQQGSNDGTTRMDAQFSIPSSVATDVAGRVVVADNATNWSSAALRIIDPHTNTVRTLKLTSADSGNAAVLTVDTKIAIDAQGNIVCANSGGVHLVTNTGLAPGYSAWWRPVFWKKPRLKLGRLLGSASTCSPEARAALKAVFSVKIRLDGGGSGVGNDDSPPLLPLLPLLLPLPGKVWHLILGMLQPWQLGRRDVASV